jgi:glucosamine--fructose-6-phosphate aminotransferase (isomerizing)
VRSALAAALARVEGSYAVVLLSRDEPGRLWGARSMSPLVLGVGPDECFLASDVPAFLEHTREVVHLGDGELVEACRGRWTVYDTAGLVERRPEPETILWDVQAAKKGGFPHFMLKEIMEQPRVIRDSCTGRVDADSLEVRLEEIDRTPLPSRLVILACGTSYYAGLWGKYVMESLARLPVEVNIASEFRYADPVLEEGAQVLVISQSGETADTLAGLHLAHDKGRDVLGMCNVVGSTIFREADTVLTTQAGPEISVASTKAMCSQMVMLLLMALSYARRKGTLADEDRAELLRGLLDLPETLVRVLPKLRSRAHELARKYAHADNFLFLGRGCHYPLALEGALKLKEISYIHAEGYAAGEMKHGPIALVDPRFPTLAIAPRDALHAKVASNLLEIKARSGRVVALTNPGHDLEVDDAWELPHAAGPLYSFLVLPALQLFAYEAAVALGRDVDQPRNLAKSVTVE